MGFGNSMRLVVCAIATILFLRGKATAQILTSNSEGVLSASIPFGNLMPAASTTPASTQIQFRLRSNNNNGYKVRASAAFNVSAPGQPDGGTTVAASDIGIGITSLTYGPAVREPRTDVIAAGFNYNPATVSAVNGLSPYTGMASGRATLADIIANPDMTILSGPKIANNQTINPPTNIITVTITFGLVGQFFTPSTLSGNLTLTIVNGP
jgi:hypothetical protein